MGEGEQTLEQQAAEQRLGRSSAGPQSARSEQSPGGQPSGDAPAGDGGPEAAVGRADGVPAAHGDGGGMDSKDSGAEHDAANVEGDLDELVEVAAQRDEYLALAQRTQADFENYRKRVAREAAAAQERGVAALARELLPALDNLDRAIDAAAGDDPLLEGVDLVRSELSAALARCGIESYRPLGEPFDPAQHEAVSTAPQPEGGAASGTVVDVYQAGYRAGPNILRPARVVVAA